MAIVERREYRPLTDDIDPDDYRPESRMALVIDPSKPDGRFVRNLILLFEKVAPGDRIPLHRHTVEEAIVIDAGTAEVTLGNDVRTVGPGATVFVPAGTPHGTRNAGPGELSLHGMFPSAVITLEYLERNPAPGTEGRPPQPPFALDVRALLEGDPSAAVRRL